jgi:pantoate--beta-alanine ligase
VSAARHATTTVVRTVAEARAAVAACERPVGLVPTMGALHDGHLALIAAAARECVTVVVSIFVNPTQFGASDDLARYPRDEARDVALATGAGATLVFAPAVAEMYLPGAAVTVHVEGPPAVGYEAAQRPGHFDGVATIVAKLFTIVAPDRAYFGRKDAQQLAVVRRLVADLDLPVEIVAVDTVREPDGLARSSRNVYLSAAQRAEAAGLHRALVAGRAVAADGAGAVVARVTAELQAAGLAIDYVAVVDPDSFAPVDADTADGARQSDAQRQLAAARHSGGARPQPDALRRPDALLPDDLIVAAVRLGETRLLDNIAIGVAAPAATTNTTSPEPDPRRGPASHDKERQRGDSHGQ